MRLWPATSTRPWCPSASGSSARSTRTPGRPRQPGPLDRGAGDAAAARDQYAALLPVYERVLGPEHRTPGRRASLAFWTGEAGDAAAARDQFAALLPVQEGVVGAETRPPSPARRDLARWTGQAGDAAAAATSSPR